MRTGDVIADRFAIDRLIGSGGMGSVFQARDRVSGHDVAIKVLDLASEGGVQRFRREARVLADLSHPAIVRYVAHGESDSREPFLAMELLDGEDLSQRLARGGLTVVESLSVVRRAAEALAFAHAKGVVHRDIKPSNLFLVGRDLARLKVLDFGIARERLQTQGLTNSGTMLGTVGYMAPEQAMGASTADCRADVFALGCVLFECFTGQPAFAGRHAIAVLAKVLSEEAGKVSDVRPELGVGFDDFVARMLAKNPDLRPQDAAELLFGLTRLLEQVPDHPKPKQSSAPASVSNREQRIVSVLLAEGLPEQPAIDGEENPVLASIRSAGERTGVDITPLQGGGLLLVVSGRGSAHDQAMEAANSALSLLRIVPGLRLALATGRIEDQDRRPVGAPIDRAAALLRSRGADEADAVFTGVLLDDMTAGLLSSRYQIERSSNRAILVGEQDDLEAARLFLGKPTPTVGRDKELALCALTLKECVDEGVSRALLVTAPPGIGKSRLVSEFISTVRASGGSRVLVARASPIGIGASLALASILVRKSIGLTAAQTPPEQEQALRKYMSSTPLGAESPIADFLGEIAGIPLDATKSPFLRAARNDPSIMYEQKRRAFEAWLDGETAKGPLLLLFEDVHWSDAPSIAYMEDALQRSSTRQLMVLATARPEVHERFPKLWQRTEVQEIRLSGLTRRSAERLVRAVLGEATEATVVTRIVDRAEGNAFYLEELVRRVAEGSTTLPETVLAMAESRLERLEAEARRVLRAASVFGEACSLGAVAALLDSNLDAAGWLEALVGRELLLRSTDGRHAGEKEYCFRHALLRDAAYAMLPEEDRRSAHCLAAAWLEAHGEKEPLVIAEHFEAGGDHMRAVRWLCSAARVAVDSGDMTQAAQITMRGRALGASGEELGLLAALEGLAATWTNQASIPQLREAIDLLPRGGPLWWSAVGGAIYKVAMSENPGDAPEFVQHVFGPMPTELTGPYGMAVCGVSGGLLALGQTQAAHAFLAQFDTLTGEDESIDPLFSAWLDLTRSWSDFASVREGAWRIERARMRARGVSERMFVCGAMLGEATARYYASCAATWLGLFEEADVECANALAFAQGAGADLLRIYVRLALIFVRIREGRIGEAFSMLESLEPTVDASQAQLRHLYFAEAHLRSGDLEKARAQARAALSGPVVGTTDLASTVMAQAQLGLGALEEALSTTERVPTSLPLFDADLLATRALALRAMDRDSQARDEMRKARTAILAIAEGISDPVVRSSFLTRVPECARTLSSAHELLGDAP